MVPKVAHFIWYGASFPWLNALALQSAHDHGALDRVVLHFDGRLEPALLNRLREQMARLELRPIDSARLFDAVDATRAEGAPLLGPRLAALYEHLTAPAAKANMLRAAILCAEGGIYLDIDTVTLAPLTSLLDKAFCGSEPIAFPEHVMRSRRPDVWARAIALHGARLLLRELPRGYRTFRNIEGLFARAANNAVLGAPPQHPFVRALLQGMVDLPESQRLVRFALGTHLLQRTVAAYAGDDFVMHPPALFYPLGPEISRHWFRIEHGARGVQLDDVLDPSTLIVHWYASVRNRAVVDRMDPAFVHEHATRQLLSALAVKTPRALELKTL
jgi:hypothetical protein